MDPIASTLPGSGLSYFFQRKEFEGERGRVQFEPPLEAAAAIEIHCRSPIMRTVLLSPFHEVSFHRYGTLHGEYVVHQNGTLLFDMNGDCIIANSPPEHAVMAGRLLSMVGEAWPSRIAILGKSEQFLRVSEAAVISSTFAKNYYHFTLDLIAGMSHLEGSPIRKIAMPLHCLKMPFQFDLFARAMGGYRAVPFKDAIQVTDPYLIQSSGSLEGLLWLRSRCGLSPRPGSKRYYVRRAATANPKPGIDLSESEAFLGLLAKFGFETVDFGGGDRPIAEQVAMVEGAQIILAPHGANLTNIAYLSAPLAVVEIFSPPRVAGVFALLSAHLGFRHVCIVSDDADAEGNVTVDCDLLEDVLTRMAQT